MFYGKINLLFTKYLYMKKILVFILAVILICAGWFFWKTKSLANAPKCGGIAGLVCPSGYSCKGMASYPDAMGYCEKIK